MKKYMIRLMVPAVTLLLTVSSCISVEIQRKDFDEELSLRPLASLSTKAGPVNFPYSTFGIYANKADVPGGTPGTEAWVNSDFWKDKTLSSLFIQDGCFSSQNGVYAGADPSNGLSHTPYYWPSAGSLMFFAYAPHKTQTENITSVIFQNRATPENQAYFTIDITLQPEAYKTFDLLWADAKDINAGKTIEKQATPLPLVFKHAMSKVTFKIKNPEEHYRLTATLLNCINSAKFFSGDTPGWLPNFKSLAVDGTFVIMKDQNLTKDYTEASIYTLPMLLDGNYQEVAAEQRKHVLLHLDIMETDGVGKQTETIDMTQYTKVWKPGINYIYTLTLSNDKIVFGKPQIVNRDSIVDL